MCASVYLRSRTARRLPTEGNLHRFPRLESTARVSMLLARMWCVPVSGQHGGQPGTEHG